MTAHQTSKPNFHAKCKVCHAIRQQLFLSLFVSYVLKDNATPNSHMEVECDIPSIFMFSAKYEYAHIDNPP